MASINKLKTFIAIFTLAFFILGQNNNVLAQTETVGVKVKEIINKETNKNISLGPGEAAIYFFYGEGCPHCAKEEKLLDKLEQENKKVKIYRFEVWHNLANAQLLKKISEELNVTIRGVPFTVAGEKTINGYYNDETTGQEIRSAIEEVCRQNGKKIEKINIPLFGEFNIKNLSLPLITIIIAALDGFNPCALWILLFLMSLLITMRDRKKILIFGGTFILTSAIFYFLILSAWFNIIHFLGFVAWIRIIVGLVALYAGYYNLKGYLINKNKGCEVVGEERRKKTFEKIKEILAREKVWLALLGIIALAVSINFLELVCSAGLPAVYTQILAISNLAQWQYYVYLSLYVFIFVLNEIIIFSVALLTLQLKAISPKIIRWIGIAGGAIMILLGILLLFKPNWLMWG